MTTRRRKHFLKKRKNNTQKKFYLTGGGNEDTEAVPPTIMSNAGKVANLGVGLVSNGMSSLLNVAGRAMGYDPNKPVQDNVKDVTNKAKALATVAVNVINSPEGQEILTKTGDVFKKTIQALKPGLEEAIEIGNDLVKKELPIMGNMANEAVLMVPGLGQVVGAVEEAGNVALATEAAVESAAKLATTGTETAANLNQHKNEAMSLFGEGKQLIETAFQQVNNGVNSVLDSSQKSVENFGKKSNEYIEQKGGARTLKYYQGYAKMIGGRIRASKKEFLKTRKNI
jgi:hypothetical protein